MQLPMFLILASIFAGAAYCGALQVVDFDGQCVIWSSNNHGCTGHSAAFSQLDGDDCSGRQRNYVRCDINQKVLTNSQSLAQPWMAPAKTSLCLMWMHVAQRTECQLRGFGSIEAALSPSSIRVVTSRSAR